MINTLFQEVDAIFPLDIEDYPLPMEFGYLRSHVRETTARKCALMSRDVFLPLMAMCSFAISFHPSPPGRPISADPPWVDILVNKAKIHPEWVNQVKLSFIGDLSGNFARVGVVVNAKTCKWTNNIRRLICANVPVWIFWSSINQPLQQSPAPRLSSFFPTRAEVMAAISTNKQRAEASDNHPASLNSVAVPDAVPDARFPQPNPNSRQRYGETWQQFFTREAIRHSKMAEKETPTATTARLDRQKESEKFNAPGKSGARVFRWEDIDGFLIRTEVYRKEVEDF